MNDRGADPDKTLEPRAPDSPCRFIAFYGTLRAGLGGAVEHKLTAHLLARGPCRIRGALLHVCDGPHASYPGLVEGTAAVAGELYELPGGADFADLDAHEGAQYERRLVRLLNPEIECWVYQYVGPQSGKVPIVGEDWATR
jgi:gamma-glutamylcyclotransferase (GGCT)/AIG2-like uncharacterized protein YtfP